MDLKITDKAFIVGGAGSGLGNAVARRLLDEGARVLVVARSAGPLESLEKHYPGKVTALAADLTHLSTHREIATWAGKNAFYGIFVNAGGPPATSFEETSLEAWDNAYTLLLRWKVALVKKLLPLLKKQNAGKIVFSESVSVKNPIPNLVLSNSLRMAVSGMAKTLSEEVAPSGITVNLLAPGYHETAAMQRLFVKKSETEKITIDKARNIFSAQTALNTLGDPDDFASMAAWLLSPLSDYVTGQTFIVDGGLVKSV